MQGGEEEIRGFARYACRSLCPRRQIRPESRRQGNRLPEEAAGRFVRNQPRQRRSRRADPADVKMARHAHRGAWNSLRVAVFSLFRRKKPWEEKAMPKISLLMPRVVVASLTVIAVVDSVWCNGRPATVR